MYANNFGIPGCKSALSTQTQLRINPAGFYTNSLTSRYHSWFLGILHLIRSGIMIRQKHINMRFRISAPDMIHFIFDALPQIISTGFKLVKLDFENVVTNYNGSCIDAVALVILSMEFLNPIFRDLIVIDCRNFSRSQLQILFSNPPPPSVRKIFTTVCPPEIHEFLTSKGISVSVSEVLFEELYYYNGKDYQTSEFTISNQTTKMPTFKQTFQTLIEHPEHYLPGIKVCAESVQDLYEYLGKNPYFQHLHFYQQIPNIDLLASSLVLNTNLTTLHLGMILSESDFEIIAQCLCSNTGIQHLHFGETVFQNYFPIVQVLARNRSLEYLHINFENLPQIMEDITTALYFNESLQNFEGNTYKTSSLWYETAVRYEYFGFNPRIERILLRNRHNAKMRTLSLFSTISLLVL